MNRAVADLPGDPPSERLFQGGQRRPLCRQVDLRAARVQGERNEKKYKLKRFVSACYDSANS
jgi:hypothetical protein